MENATHENKIKLTAFQAMEGKKELYFPFAFIAYFLIILFNCSIIFVIRVDKNLHEPMYIFLCNLLLSELIGATSFYIKFMFDLHTNNEVISLTACYTQNFFIYIYVSAEISILTVMAHDRYISINFPLHYVTRISSRRVKLLIFAAWMYSITVMSVGISLVTRLPLCGYEINRVYCSNWEIVKLSCIDTNTNNIFGFLIICSLCLPLVFIIYSYIKILRVCWNNSKSHKFKAFQTCVPHLVTLFFFTSSVLFEVIESRLNLKRALNTLTLFASLEFLTLPPLVNPLVYGIILPEIRKKIVYVVFCKEGKMSVH